MDYLKLFVVWSIEHCQAAIVAAEDETAARMQTLLLPSTDDDDEFSELSEVEQLPGEYIGQPTVLRTFEFFDNN